MKKKVLIAIQKLTVGGISSSLVSLLNHLNKEHPDELEIDLFTFSSANMVEDIPKNINVIHGKKLLELSATPFYDVLRSKRPIDVLLRAFLIFYVRIIGSEAFYKKMLAKHRADKKYDVAISYSNDVAGEYFNQGTNLYVADYVNADKKYAWIHTDPIKMGFDKNHCEKVYKNYDSIICVSKAVKESFDTLIPVYSDKTEVFYNIFDADKLRAMSEEYVPFAYDGRLNIVTVCRIDNETKRVDGIVRLCHRLKSEGITAFKWRIVGDGPALKSNVKLAQQLGVTDIVEFVGEKKNPYPYVLHSDLFALYSAYEGHPMVIGEAIAIGTYILTTNYAAAKEQIQVEYGCIASSDEAFFETIKAFIKKVKK